MRKIAVLLLLLMMAAFLCSCGDPKDSLNPSDGASSSVDDGWTPPVK